MAVTSYKQHNDVQSMKGNTMRTYTKTIHIREILKFVDTLLKQYAENSNVSLGWQLDMWICEQVQKDYPEVDWVFEYTSAKDIDAEIEIAVDFDIDQYRDLQQSIQLRKDSKELRAMLKSITAKGETANE